MSTCRHSTLYFASGGYYVLCARCGQSWVAKDSAGNWDYKAGNHGLDGSDLRVEVEKKQARAS